MQPKPFHINAANELGNLFREEARLIAGYIFFWLAAMALIACPVWMPLLIEYFLRR